jgi:MFS family permease
VILTSDPRSIEFDRRLLAPLILGAILNPVNTSIIAVALVPIAAAFHAPVSQTLWLVWPLYLATSIGQPLVGRLVDLYGPRRLYLMGTALTGVAGIIGSAAPTLGVLVVARVVLGFGTCAGYPAAMYLIRSEADRTGRGSPAYVLTALSVSTQTVAVVGPPLGGLLVELGGWRSTFALNLPLSLACLLLGYVVLPRDTARTARGRARPVVDVGGILLFAATLIPLLLFLVTPRAERLWLLGIAAAAAGGFTVRERRCADPFIDVRVLAGNVPLLVTYARGVVAATVAYAFIYGFTQWLEDGHGLGASTAGLILLPTFAVGIAVATVTGRRPQIRAKLVVAPIWLLVTVAAILGVPQGLANLAIQNTLYHQAQADRIGASAGLLRTFMYVGAMLASSAAGAFFPTRADTPGLRHLALTMLAAATIFLIITVADRSLAGVDRAAAERPGQPE